MTHSGKTMDFNHKSDATVMPLRQSERSSKRAVEEDNNQATELVEYGRKQPETNRDTLCLLEGLNEYKGLLSTFPDILLVHRASTNKIQESAGKFSESEIQMVQSRADVITYTVLAEMNHFQTHRVGDFKNYMQTFISGQIQFYHEITRRLQESLGQINSA